MEYKGFAIEYDFYGMGEYSVQYCGDDVMFNSMEEAKAFIDEVAVRKGGNRMTIKDPWSGNDVGVELQITTYRKPMNRVALQLWCEDGPYATLSVNLPDQYIKDPAGEFFVDTNNCPFAEEFLVKNGIAKPVEGGFGFSGFCMYPLYRLITY